MAQNVTIAGASYPDVPAITVPKTGGGTASFMDTSDADASASDVRSGKKFYGATGVDTGSMADGTATTPATTITASPSISVSSGGLITASVSTSQSVTPTVSSGYIASGTAGTITVSGSNTSQMSVQGAQTITPSTSNQSISSGKYLTGVQTILGDANLVAANIAKDVTIFGVTGTLSGGSFSNTDALIHANAPLGSTVTLSKNSVTVTEITPSDAFPNVDGTTADYYYSVSSANFGTWDITATLDGKTKSETVSVNSAGQYDVKLLYAIIIIENGVRNTSIAQTVVGLNVTQYNGYIHYQQASGAPSTEYISFGAVDVTPYSTLTIKMKATSLNTNAPNQYIGLSTSVGAPNSNSRIAYTTMSSATTLTVGITSFTGNRYVSICAANSGNVPKIDLYEVFLT